MIKNNAKYNILKNLFLENSIVSEISSGLKVELDSGIPTGGLNSITTSIPIFLGHLVVIF